MKYSSLFKKNSKLPLSRTFWPKIANVDCMLFCLNVSKHNLSCDYVLRDIFSCCSVIIYCFQLYGIRYLLRGSGSVSGHIFVHCVPIPTGVWSYIVIVYSEVHTIVLDKQ